MVHTKVAHAFEQIVSLFNIFVRTHVIKKFQQCAFRRRDRRPGGLDGRRGQSRLGEHFVRPRKQARRDVASGETGEQPFGKFGPLLAP